MNNETLVKTILILAANPASTSRLLLDEEVREIEEGLRRANKRDLFKLEQKWAVRLFSWKLPSDRASYLHFLFFFPLFAALPAYPGYLNMSTGKGIKRIKNQPVFYTELKKERAISLTDTVWNKLTEIATREGISRSEVVERMVRNIDAC